MCYFWNYIQLYIYILKERRILFGLFSYASIGYGWKTRFILHVIAINWILAFMLFIPKIKISILSYFGANTFPVYLLHYFVRYIANEYRIFKTFQINNLLLAIILSFLVYFVFGNKWVNGLFKIIFSKKKKNIIDLFT